MAGHGGNLSAARRAFPRAPIPWLDLSTGINPHAYPICGLDHVHDYGSNRSVIMNVVDSESLERDAVFRSYPTLALETFTRLPDPDALYALELAARKAYQAPAPCQVVAAPGTQAIISLMPWLWPARRVGILGFTYGEHERAWRAGGAEVMIVDDLAALAQMDVAIVVNPNNPDGRLVAAKDLRGLGGALAAHDGLLIVDEAFIDFLEPAASLVPNMPGDHAMVLRSFGKTFGLAGLRLGFALAPKVCADKLRAALGPWPVSGAAIAIGTRALADFAWLTMTRHKLTDDGAALDMILQSVGLGSVGGSSLYRLVRHDEAQSLFEGLASAGILARRFDARPTWLRFGIPGRDADRDRLQAALGAILAT